MGRIMHRKCVEKWKANNKAAIREYNKAYYLRNRHIILYNKRCREETESVCILDEFESKPEFQPKKDSGTIISINPQRK
jgi:hypothetical protein